VLPAPSDMDSWDMNDEERAAAGARPLAHSLNEALDVLQASSEAREWFGDTFFDVYLRFKRAELQVIEGLTEAETCRRYADIY
jgi:glutamine synthetase